MAMGSESHMELGIASAKRGMQFGEMKKETNSVVFAKDVKEKVNEVVHVEKRMLTKLGQKGIGPTDVMG
ncbi:hypothetical protein V6N12_011696 [Hibiscus sabdariffa]|uniref:Uncharacterized protein n=1 Tax=Hibiscus sabdariffa TaxID=183260 RepID=A0ABR2B7H2_9ROSI